jgi:hypothetical protein
MQSPFSSACTVIFTLVISFFAVEKLCLLHEEYLVQSQIIEKDSWLRERCADPQTYSKINHHPGLCEKIETTARIGAVWHAINKVAGSLPIDEAFSSFHRASWQFMALLAVIILVFPSVIISHFRQRQDQLPVYYQDARTHKQCV